MLSKKILKELLELQTKKGRKLKEKFLIEGVRLCQEAIESDWRIEQLYYSQSFPESENGEKILLQAKQKKINFILVQEKVIKKLAETETPQGIVALVQKKNFSLKEVLAQNPTIILALENLKDPGNLGTIIRTADACGVQAVLSSPGAVELYNSKVLRTSMGSIFHLNFVNNLNFASLIGITDDHPVNF